MAAAATTTDTNPHLHFHSDLDLFITKVLELTEQLATRVEALEKSANHEHHRHHNQASVSIKGKRWDQEEKLRALTDAVQRRISIVPNQSAVENRDLNLRYSFERLFDSYDLDYVHANMHLMTYRFSHYASRMFREVFDGNKSVQSEAKGFFQSPEFLGIGVGIGAVTII